MQASLIGWGTSKSGCPIEKLIGSFILAARSKTLRMPLESKALVRSARRDMGARGSGLGARGASQYCGDARARQDNWPLGSDANGFDAPQPLVPSHSSTMSCISVK